MSWKHRKRKQFFREVAALKKSPMFLIDKYIVIDETHDHEALLCKDRQMWQIDEKIISSEDMYKISVAEGEIKHYIDFDNYFNPDLTFNPRGILEKTPQKDYLLKRQAMNEIGLEWKKRLLENYPDYNYTLVMYFLTDMEQWMLDFYNGPANFENSDEYSDIKYFCKAPGQNPQLTKR